MERIKIVLVDDHKVIREGIRSFLEEDCKYLIVGEASNGIQALSLLEREEVDVVMIDINMEEMGGIDCTKEIKLRFPKIQVLAFTMLNENLHIKEMINSGASGYLLKSCEEETIKQAIETIYQGGTYYSPEVSQTIMRGLSRKRFPNFSKVAVEMPLTQREKEVLELVVKEYSNQEIADELFISPRTVEAHKRNLLEKTGSKNAAGLVLYALRKELLPQ